MKGNFWVINYPAANPPRVVSHDVKPIGIEVLGIVLANAKTRGIRFWENFKSV